MRLSATSDADCAQCHADLKLRAGTTTYGSAIASFADAHPEFAVLRDKRLNPDTIKLNHAVHLRPDLRAPNGPVQMEGGDCHRPPAAVNGSWRFGDAPYRIAAAAT